MVFVNNAYALNQHLIGFALWDADANGAEQTVWINNTEISSIREFTLPKQYGLKEERRPVSLIAMKNGHEHLVKEHAIERLREVVEGRAS